MPFKETDRMEEPDRNDGRHFGPARSPTVGAELPAMAARFPKSMDTRPTRAYDVDLDRHASPYGPTPATGSCSFHAHRRQGRGAGPDACFT
jgi:hypothetical protein